MFVYLAFVTGFCASIVNGVAPPFRPEAFRAPRALECFDPFVPKYDFGPCTDVCVRHRQICPIDWAGPVNFTCVCTSENINAMAACDACLLPVLDDFHARIIMGDVANTVNVCKTIGLPVDMLTSQEVL